MALDIDYAKIAAIGIGLDTEPQTYIVHNEDEEREILGYTFGLIGNSWAPVIGYNLVGFDMPILKRRAWALGIRPEGARMVEIRRYSKELVDLMLLLYHQGYGPGPKFRGLKQAYAMFVGPNPLHELDGSQVSEMDEDMLRLYLENDIIITQELYPLLHLCLAHLKPRITGPTPTAY